MSTRFRDLSPANICTTRDGSLNGSPRKNKSLIKLKIAVFAPMASASVTTAMMVNPGVLARVRSAYLRSEIIGIYHELIACERSFGAKCNHRINPRSAARRQPAGDHHRDAEHERGANARNQIRGRHFGPLISHQTHDHVSCECAGSEA